MMQIDLREIPVLYINLAQHTEKNDNMQKMLKECGFKNIQRVEGCICEGTRSNESDRAAGCSQSHYKIFCQIATPPSPFIVFEDDCVLNTFRPVIEVPQQADAVYLGIAQSGVLSSHTTPFVEYEQVDSDLYRIYNMTSSHSILYLSGDYVNMCKRIAYHAGYVIKGHLDYGFAEVQRWFNVYAFDKPLFHQKSSAQVTRVCLTNPLLKSNYDIWKPTFRPQAISPRSAPFRRENDYYGYDGVVKLVQRHRLLFIVVRSLGHFYIKYLRKVVVSILSRARHT